MNIYSESCPPGHKAELVLLYSGNQGQGLSRQAGALAIGRELSERLEEHRDAPCLNDLSLDLTKVLYPGLLYIHAFKMKYNHNEKITYKSMKSD